MFSHTLECVITYVFTHDRMCHITYVFTRAIKRRNLCIYVVTRAIKRCNSRAIKRCNLTRVVHKVFLIMTRAVPKDGP